MSDLDLVYNKIRKECINKILEDKINIEELSFKMGCGIQNLLDLLKNKKEDLSIYLKLYDILVNW